MKRWLLAIILALALSIDGIGESQTKSKFPKIDKDTAVNVEFDACPNGTLFTVTGYGKANDISFYVYEVDDTIFAVIEFEPSSNKAIAIYILNTNKNVFKFTLETINKAGGPCATIADLKLINKRNVF